MCVRELFGQRYPELHGHAERVDDEQRRLLRTAAAVGLQSRAVRELNAALAKHVFDRGAITAAYVLGYVVSELAVGDANRRAVRACELFVALEVVAVELRALVEQLLDGRG